MSTPLQIADLPSTIHLFSIARFLLLPGTTLPLTITHLRSQEILDAAEEEGGYLGVILTRPQEDRASSRYYEVGGLGRITRLERDEEGHHVTLEGVIRFRVTEELGRDEDELPRAAVTYAEFERDLNPPEEDLTGWNLGGMRDALLEISRRQSGRDKTPLESMNARQLVRLLAQTVPMAAAEKQALLEAPTFRELLELLFQLLAVNFLTTTPDGSPSPRAN
jgi:Lon protease-like protein